jgi:hypothetical protein
MIPTSQNMHVRNLVAAVRDQGGALPLILIALNSSGQTCT